MPQQAETPTIATPWLTLAEAAGYAKRGQNTIWLALTSGELEGNQTGKGGKWLIHRDALDAWIRGEKAAIEIPKVTRRRPA